MAGRVSYGPRIQMLLRRLLAKPHGEFTSHGTRPLSLPAVRLLVDVSLTRAILQARPNKAAGHYPVWPGD